ncbi:MAG: hypothetical protein SH868_15615 [Bythopirellula sp.]|nr:hypothetical protein [Bythopirellula sp.]
MNSRIELCLEHLDRMTDSTGLIQHAIYSIPRRESGYCTDDNARALRVCTRLWQQEASEAMLNRVTTYLSFLEHAQCSGRGFHNFMGYDRSWLDAEGCGDCQGQAVLALAEVLGSDLPDGYRLLARELIKAVLPALADLRSLRAQAYIILAWGHLRNAGVKDIEILESVAWSAANRLTECYERSLRHDWFWFESRMTYANAVLPHSMMIAAQRWPQEKFLSVATSSFDFLEEVTTVENMFQPIGNDGWYEYGEEKAVYDQQPVEAATMAEAALAAHELTGDIKHLATFNHARDWFFGQNSMSQPLVDSVSHSCFDGLSAKGVNRNQGAESTLAYLLVAILDSASEAMPIKKRQLKGA